MTQAPVVSTQRGWVPDDQSFGARLAMVRQRMGWNVEEAARECSIAPSTWATWERDDRTPQSPMTVVQQICERTGCDYLWLLTGKHLAGAA